MHGIPGTITDRDAEVRLTRAALVQYFTEHEGEVVLAAQLLPGSRIVANTTHNGATPDVVRVETVDRLPNAGGRYLTGVVEDTGEEWAKHFNADAEVELVEGPVTW